MSTNREPEATAGTATAPHSRRRGGATLLVWPLAPLLTGAILAVLLAARILFPHVDHLHPDIESWLSEAIGLRVSIG